jgi:hypothetical protein
VGEYAQGIKKRCRETMHQGPAVFKTNFQAGPFLDNKDRRTKIFRQKNDHEIKEKFNFPWYCAYLIVSLQQLFHKLANCFYDY